MASKRITVKIQLTAKELAVAYGVIPINKGNTNRLYEGTYLCHAVENVIDLAILRQFGDVALKESPDEISVSGADFPKEYDDNTYWVRVDKKYHFVRVSTIDFEEYLFSQFDKILVPLRENSNLFDGRYGQELSWDKTQYSLVDGSTKVLTARERLGRKLRSMGIRQAMKRPDKFFIDTTTQVIAYQVD